MNLSHLIIRLIDDHAVNIKDLHRYLTEYGIQISEREMRDHISEVMIKKEGYCIQSNSNGYILVKTPEQLRGAVAYIDSYIKNLSERKRALIDNYERQRSNLVQLNIFAK